MEVSDFISRADAIVLLDVSETTFKRFVSNFKKNKPKAYSTATGLVEGKGVKPAIVYEKEKIKAAYEEWKSEKKSGRRKKPRQRKQTERKTYKSSFSAKLQIKPSDLNKEARLDVVDNIIALMLAQDLSLDAAASECGITVVDFWNIISEDAEAHEKFINARDTRMKTKAELLHHYTYESLLKLITRKEVKRTVINYTYVATPTGIYKTIPVSKQETTEDFLPTASTIKTAYIILQELKAILNDRPTGNLDYIDSMSIEELSEEVESLSQIVRLNDDE